MSYVDLLRLIHNLIRLGTIAEVDHARARVRVKSGGLLTAWLPWVASRAGNTRDWSPPTLGEQVIVFSPGSDPAAGIVLSGIFSDAHPAPSSEPNIIGRWLPDGTHIKYDHAEHRLSIECVGDIELTVDGNLTAQIDQPLNGATALRAYSKAAFDPTYGINIRLPDDEDPDPFTQSEIEKILSTPTKRIQELNLIKYALYDGPRTSEVQALAWEDVLDVEHGIVRYRRAVVRGRFKVTKTKRSTRMHHLLKPAREALLGQWALTGNLPAQTYEIVDRDNRTVRTEKLRLVFLNSLSGKPFYENALRERFWKVHLEHAGVRYRGPNQCRHTFISQMLSLGVVPLHWIAQHVGHATIDMIQRRYGKWIRTDGQDVTQMIEKLLDL